MKADLNKYFARLPKFTTTAALSLALLLSFIPSVRAETFTKSFTYDLNGNVSSRTTPNNATINYTYDALNKLESVSYPDGSTVKYTYDPNGNRSSMTDSHGITSYGYYPYNRLAGVHYPGFYSVSYEYDNSGNLTKISLPDGTNATYVYDTSNRLIKVTDQNGITQYDYDNTSNNLIKKTLPNGVYTSYLYDTAKRITDVVNKKSDGSVIAGYHYEYDANSNRTYVAETTAAGAKTTSYIYDNLNRLTRATCSDGTFEAFDYDKSGNRLTKTTQSGMITYSYDQDNRLLRAGNTAFFYDNSGNLTQKRSATKTTTYAYDYENRLTNYSDGTNTVTFQYDGDGNRIAKTANGVTTKYVNETRSPISQVLLETNAQNLVTARYSYGDSRLSQTNQGVTSYYLYDNPGRSVAAVVNGSQTVLNNYAYNVFGGIKTNNETTPNNFLYAGEQYDDETDLIYLRKRYYDPELGRFISKDAFPGYVTQPQTINPFTYTSNNPVNGIDPSGLASTSDKISWAVSGADLIKNMVIMPKNPTEAALSGASLLIDKTSIVLGFAPDNKFKSEAGLVLGTLGVATAVLGDSFFIAAGSGYVLGRSINEYEINDKSIQQIITDNVTNKAYDLLHPQNTCK